MTGESRILLSHGSGGRKSAELVSELFVEYFGNPVLNLLGDSAVLDISSKKLAFTTDSFVVSPLFFPGGDIGKLAVCGTVNDLAAAGSKPLALSVAFVLEEGLEIEVLRKVVASMAKTAQGAGVSIVAGDTKVVPQGSADKLFVTTSGIGVLDSKQSHPSAEKARAGDVVIINGTIGDHGMAVMMARENIEWDSKIESDCAPLNGLVSSVLNACRDVHCLRDPTRGGLAAALNEIAIQSGVCIEIDETSLPIKEDVRVACELLGIDPLHIANEGKMIVIVPPEESELAISVMRDCEYGREAAVIGRVLDGPPGFVQIRTSVGTLRVVDIPSGELLPRIC